MFDEEADFASRLILLLDDDASEKSIIFSPASILTGLAMFYVGCDGDTATEIMQLIAASKGKSRNEIIDLFSSSLTHYKESYKNVKQNVKIKFANKIFISNICDLLSTFCEIIETKFHGGFQQIDFNDNKTAASQINNFVKNETNGLISTIINENEIDINTYAILVNAVYFKAPWELIFEEIKMTEFKSNPTKTIKFMYRKVPQSWWWNYVENDKWTALGIPYENYKAWIYFVLPKEDYSLKELLMNGNNFREWTRRERSPFINVAIPFIDTQYEINLNDKLQKLGMKTAFTKKCNAKNMTESPIFLKKAFHKATITTDEKGTEASAASSCSFETRSGRLPTHSFIADRPFLYFITTVENPATPKFRDPKEFYGSLEEESYIDVSEVTTEPFNLLFVGTFC